MISILLSKITIITHIKIISLKIVFDNLFKKLYNNKRQTFDHKYNLKKVYNE